MRAWTRGERIGFFSLVVGALTCTAVLLSVPAVQDLIGRLLRSGEEPAAVTKSAADPKTETLNQLLEEQRRLLEEHSQATRAEVVKLHDERMDLRKQRIEALAEKFSVRNERSFDKLLLRNKCSHDISVALHYMDLDDSWISRGWWAVKPGETVTTDAMTRNSYVFFFGENRTAGRQWDGVGKEGSIELAIADVKFDQLDGETFVYPGPRTVSFFRRETGNTWTDFTETFECLLEAPPH